MSSSWPRRRLNKKTRVPEVAEEAPVEVAPAEETPVEVATAEETPTEEAAARSGPFSSAPAGLAVEVIATPERLQEFWATAMTARLTIALAAEAAAAADN